MSLSEFMRSLREKLQIIIIVILLITAFTFAISTVITPKYRSDISILIIQKQPEDKVDAFSASKSAEYLSDIFSKIIYTDSFVDDVLKSPMNITKKFSGDYEERKEQWEKEVETKKINNTGIIEISVFDASRKQAEKIAQGISWNLANNGTKYHGGGEKVSIRIIDGPTTTSSPVSPNILLNTLLALIVSVIGTFSAVYFFGASKQQE